MAIFEQNEAVIIDKVEPPGLVKVSTWIGKRMDMHCTGVGKAMLAYLSDDELDHLIQEHGLSKHNENTSTLPRKLSPNWRRSNIYTTLLMTKKMRSACGVLAHRYLTILVKWWPLSVCRGRQTKSLLKIVAPWPRKRFELHRQSPPTS